MAGTLEVLALKCAEARGLDYYMAYETLKDYISYLTIGELLEDIGKIEDVRAFPSLIAAGLPWTAQLKMTEVWKRLA